MPNQVITENWQPGTSDWRISNPSLAEEIEGFASATSVLPGETIHFFVSTKAPAFSLQIFRMGWYGGAGGRLMKEEPLLPGVDQSAATAQDPTFGTVHCTNWQKSYSLQVPETWVSGIYLVKLSTIPKGTVPPLERYMIFVVRAPYYSHLLWISPVNTYHAYNGLESDGRLGFSLYDLNAGQHVNAVSFNRPYTDGLGAGDFLYWEYPMLFWLEGNGYDVTYATSEDLHTGRVVYSGLAFLSIGHDEYWSFEMRALIERAIASGISVGFFGANPMYWQVRFENDTEPMATNRNMVCFKCLHNCHCPYASGEVGPCLDAFGIVLCKDPPPIGRDPWDTPEASAYERKRLTARWRDLLLARPEQDVVGQMYQDWVRSSGQTFPWVVVDDAHWVFTGTGLNNGDHVDGIIGAEFDRVFEDGEKDTSFDQTSDYMHVSKPAKILAKSKFTNDDPTGQNGNMGDQCSNSTIYQAPSGAWVFSAGTITWSWGLADEEGFGPAGFRNRVAHNFADERIQLLTANILNTIVTGFEPVEPGGQRIGVLARDGTLFVKEGALDAAWWVQGSRILKFALEGNRIGVLTQDGNLFVREGTLFGTVFHWESSNVREFALAGNRIGVLQNDGTVYVKEGSWDAPWTWESSPVQTFALAGDRIGVLLNDGTLYVKEGPLDAPWTPAIPNVQSFVLAGNRIGFLDNAGNVNVIEGALSAIPAPHWESSDVQSFALAGDRIGVLHNDGNLFVKEGAWDASWTPAIPNVQSFVLAGNRVGFLDNLGNVSIIEGALNPLPATRWESSNVREFALAGNRIGVLQNDGTVYVKEGPWDASWTPESWNVQSFALERLGIGGTRR